MASSSSSSSSSHADGNPVSVSSAMDMLKEIYVENHPGTTIGCLDLISTNFESCVNQFIEETLHSGATSEKGTQIDVFHRRNDMYHKLLYLNGKSVNMYDANGKFVGFNVQQKISDDVFKLFDTIREKRNGHLHENDSIYNVINAFDNIVVRTEKQTKFKFKKNGELTALVYPNDTPDLVPGTPDCNDMIVELCTRKEFLASAYPKEFMGPGKTHGIILYYGTKRHIFTFSRYDYNKWRDILLDGSNYHRKTLYFKFDIHSLMRRIRYESSHVSH